MELVERQMGRIPQRGKEVENAKENAEQSTCSNIALKEEIGTNTTYWVQE